jgi:hypothetical protein
LNLSNSFIKTGLRIFFVQAETPSQSRIEFLDASPLKYQHTSWKILLGNAILVFSKRWSFVSVFFHLSLFQSAGFSSRMMRGSNAHLFVFRETGARWRDMVTCMSFRSYFTRVAPLAALLVSSVATVRADERTIRVEVDHARIVKVPEGAQTLVVGNPLIADVTMLKANHLMVVTGKGFGSTNLVVLDRSGSQVGESIITVVPAEDKVVVQRGAHRESLSCRPNCARAIDLADDVQYMRNAIEGAKAYEGATSTRK